MTKITPAAEIAIEASFEQYCQKGNLKVSGLYKNLIISFATECICSEDILAANQFVPIKKIDQTLTTREKVEQFTKNWVEEKHSTTFVKEVMIEFTDIQTQHLNEKVESLKIERDKFEGGDTLKAEIITKLEEQLTSANNLIASLEVELDEWKAKVAMMVPENYEWNQPKNTDGGI